MHVNRWLWMMLLAVLVGSQSVVAQEGPVQVTVRIAAVKEADWQQEMARGVQPEGLRERLQARTLVELSGILKEEGAAVLRRGETRDVVTEWEFDRVKDQAIARKTMQEFIGTQMTLQQEPPKNHAGATRISLSLTHDLAPPQLLSYSYANAAVGAEREKHTVTSPRYERVRWQGEVLVGVHERVIASFAPARDPGTRIVVFFKGSAGSTTAPMLDLQQTIYRVPELEMIEWLLQGRPDDAALAEHVQKIAAAGQASVVYSSTLTLAPDASAEMQSGTEWWLPAESDQVLDRLYLVPSNFDEAQEGTRLKMHASGGFQSFYSPRAPLAVQWPTSWLRVHDEQGAGSKALYGWMDWYDRFEQESVGASFSASTSPQLVAMMPPADQVWGTEHEGRWLDVTLVQLSGDVPKPATQPATPKPADPFAPSANPFATGWEVAPPTRRSLFLGIALESSAAHALLTARQPEKDEALLRDLLDRLKRGQARLITSAFSAHSAGRHEQSSARIHAFPVEMPSIPSAWAEEHVGTRLEQDEDRVSLTQHLAPPARSEWRLAQDVPEAVMWEPRFRKFSLLSTTAAVTMHGTHLLAAVQIPAVMASTDLPANETLLLFSHLDSGDAAPQITRQDVEIETLTFDIPAKDSADWQEMKSADFATFTQQRLKDGRARLRAQTLLRTQPVPWAKLAVVEEYLTATEFDPPSVRAPLRMRPTALQAIPVGLQLKTHVSTEDDGTFVLNLNLQHSTAKPVEPSLEETLKISADANTAYSGAKHEFQEWAEEEIHLLPSLFHQIGSPRLTGGADSISLTWVRVRPCGPPLKP